MRAIVAIMLAPLTACGLISGLDSLEIGDGGDDATIEGATDALADQMSPPDGSVDVVVDVAKMDAKADSPPVCGTIPCNFRTSTCCAVEVGSTGSDTCIMGGTVFCQPNELQLHCASFADCDAGVCCYMPSMVLPQAICQTTCNGTILCDPNLGIHSGCTGTCAYFDSGFEVNIGMCE